MSRTRSRRPGKRVGGDGAPAISDLFGRGSGGNSSVSIFAFGGVAGAGRIDGNAEDAAVAAAGDEAVDGDGRGDADAADAADEADGADKRRGAGLSCASSARIPFVSLGAVAA